MVVYGQKPIRKILCPRGPVNGHDTESLSGSQHAKCPCLGQLGHTPPNIKPLPMHNVAQYHNVAATFVMTFVNMSKLPPWHQPLCVIESTVHFDEDERRRRYTATFKRAFHVVFHLLVEINSVFLFDGWTNHGCSQTG